jgi:hypothetical protein
MVTRSWSAPRFRAGAIVLALAAALGCDEPKQPGQHWSHPVGKQPKPQRQGPHQRHFRDAGAKEDALAPDAAVEVFIP